MAHIILNKIVLSKDLGLMSRKPMEHSDLVTFNLDHSLFIGNIQRMKNIKHSSLSNFRLANQKIMELGAQIEDLQELQKTTVSGDEMVEIRKKLNEQVQMTQQKDTVIQKERDAVTELQNQLTAQSGRIEHLQEEIVKKDEEKRAMEDKYKTYLEKAKAVS